MNEYQNIPPHKPFNVLLVGDLGLDIYQYCEVVKLSPEAPVPVVRVLHEDHLPGMAANVKQNLNNLGINVVFVYGEVSFKTRIIDQPSGQHLLRMDADNTSHPALIDCSLLAQYDAIVFSDYLKGTVSYELVENARAAYSGPIFVDSKKHDLSRFNGCIVKINEHEYLSRTSETDTLIVTLGGNGASLTTSQGEQQFPAHPINVVDICGAGDTFLAALVYQYLNTQDLSQAIEYANRAASVTVQHVGCYAPLLKEIP
jgi:bifunctional ADP-heptose synthase (sugar kinase/adenylyltransferase)